MKKLVINRSEWDAGQENGALLHKNSSELRMQCCLGHYCTSIGIDDNILKNTDLPSSISLPLDNPLFKKSGNKHTSNLHNFVWEDIFAFLNDSEEVPREPDGVREQWIKEGFKQILDIDVEFVGEYQMLESYL